MPEKPKRQPRPINQHNTAARIESRRALSTAFFEDKARATVQAAIRRGDIIPRPGSSEWLAIIEEGIEAGLLRRPNGRGK